MLRGWEHKHLPAVSTRIAVRLNLPWLRAVTTAMIKSITVRALEDNTGKFVLRTFDLASFISVALGYGKKKVSLCKNPYLNKHSILTLADVTERLCFGHNFAGKF